MTTDFPLPILMVLLNECFPVDKNELEALLKEQLNPNVSVVGDLNGESGMVVTWNDISYAVMAIDQPIPKDTFDVALKTSQGLKDGKGLVDSHQAHLIISPLNGTNNQLKAIFTALGVMTLADVLAEKASPLGFYWSNSEVLADKQQFANYTGKAGEAIAGFNQKMPNALYGLPATYWAGLRMISPDRKTQFGAITKGLDAITGFEIQIEPYPSTPAEVAKHLFSMVSYILANGPIFKEGNTIGIEQDKNFRMNFAPAKPGLPARWVMKLEAVCAAS